MIKGLCHCGDVSWQSNKIPDSATACNCTVCRRYGVLWTYGYEGEDITVTGDTGIHKPGSHIGFHFCQSCGCVAYWRMLNTDDEGRRRIAVNLRLTEPDLVSNVPIHRFDGLESFKSLPSDGRCVADLLA